MNSIAAAVAVLAFSPVLATSLPTTKNVLEVAETNGSFATLLAAVRAAELDELLSGEGPFTVFAPTDEAFAKLPEGLVETLLEPRNRAALVRLLQHHVVAGRVDAVAAVRAGRAPTAASTTLDVRIRDGRLRIADANVLATDVDAKNGLIHVVDAVLIPAGLELAPAYAPSVELIAIAIDRGVPLFNAGQTVACASVYEVAARGLLLDPSADMSQATREQIERAIETAHGQRAGEAAWTLRRALDAALADLIGADEMTDSSADGSPAKALFTFANATDADGWRIVNDTVMGGRSSSRVDHDAANERMTFRGELSLENNGGFASCRALVPEGVLDDAAGIEMRVRGDGRTYRLNVSKHRTIRGDVYDHEFATRAGQWTTVRIPFARMERNVMGRRPLSTPPTGDEIRMIGLLLGDKIPGAFELTVDWIRAY